MKEIVFVNVYLHEMSDDCDHNFDVYVQSCSVISKTKQFLP